MDNNNTVIDKSNLEDKFGKQIPYMKYNKIFSTVRSKIRNLPQTCLVDNSIPNLCLTNFSKVNNKQVYTNLVKAMYTTPTSQHRWVEHYPSLETNGWKKVYLLPSKLVSNSYLTNLQYKIIHRFFNCNYKLYVWNISDSPNCKIKIALILIILNIIFSIVHL